MSILIFHRYTGAWLIISFNFNYMLCFGVKKEHWLWGYKESKNDGPIEIGKRFGLGPLFHLSWF